MPKKSKSKATDAIETTQAKLPHKCPACWRAVPTQTRESGGVLRLVCAVCAWSERYLVTDGGQ